MTDGRECHGKSLQPMRLYVCTTCREALETNGAGTSEPVRAGAKLHAALLAEPASPGIEIVPIECLSVCKIGRAHV